MKAVELVSGIPTGSVYGLSDPSVEGLIFSFRTSTYRTIPSAELAGAELCASIENAYAIALGACDGVHGRKPGRTHDNAKALLLEVSVEEMGAIVATFGRLI